MTWQITRFRDFGYGYKFNVEILDAAGNLRRVLACQTTERGTGLCVGGVWVNLDLAWKGYGRMRARERVRALLAGNPEWLQVRAKRRETV